MLTETQLFDLVRNSVRPYDKADACMKRNCQLKGDSVNGRQVISILLPNTDRIRVRDGRNCVVKSAKEGDKFNFCNKDKSLNVRLKLMSVNHVSPDDNMVDLIFEVTSEGN